MESVESSTMLWCVEEGNIRMEESNIRTEGDDIRMEEVT